MEMEVEFVEMEKGIYMKNISNASYKKLYARNSMNFCQLFRST